ncbi:nicotinate phosphoribosyltransferase [Acinetobacter sp.]|uniref:nicotinate phosphoribosyltransferase n=1 Tax=Acinetobacter sp. TaxID=472 RepID=UPI0037501A10
MSKPILDTSIVTEFNIITATDSYKVTHWKQYPKGTQYVRSYLEARAGARYPYTLFFGLQYWIKRYLVGVQVTQAKIEKAAKKFALHFGDPDGALFNRAGWEYILKVHCGRLPIRIMAVREGTKVPVSNVLITVENTDPNCAWLVNYVETLLVQTWYPITVATRSHYLKGVITKALQESGDPMGIYFKLHDFGFRGVTCPEQAAIGGASHLVNFYGTDTFAGIELLEDYYHGDTDSGGYGYPGYSIPATEHSTVTSWGRDGEAAAVGNLLTAYPTGLVACVADSYDTENFVGNIIGGVHRDAITKREGTFVVRPDSGDPHILVPQILDILYRKIGGTINSKGYIILDPHVRVIQGDGIDDVSVGTILKAIMDEGFSADNLAFGSGGGLLQKLDRDTQRFAFKCSQITIDGEIRDVYKTPKTDPTKNSKRGHLKLLLIDNEYTTERFETPGEDQLNPVFDTGHILFDTTLADVRTLAEK